MTAKDASQIAARKLFPTSEGYNNVDKQAEIILSVFAPLLSAQNPVDELMLNQLAAQKKAADNKIADDRLAALGKYWDELDRAHRQFEKRCFGGMQ